MTTVRPVLPRAVRQRCEATIERLIAFLDAHDGETEGDPLDDGELDPSEQEPWLGAPETTCEATSQTTDSQEYTWSLLGGVAFGHDYEHDPAECGIADSDGQTEQMMLHAGIYAEAEPCL